MMDQLQPEMMISCLILLNVNIPVISVISSLQSEITPQIKEANTGLRWGFGSCCSRLQLIYSPLIKVTIHNDVI